MIKKLKLKASKPVPKGDWIAYGGDYTLYDAIEDKLLANAYEPDHTCLGDAQVVEVITELYAKVGELIDAVNRLEAKETNQ